MSVKSRFWNSVNQDRPYDATDWAAWFVALITDGVCHEDDLKVTTQEESASGYAGVVQVGLGSAFIQGYMISVEGQPQSISIQASSASANREDMIVARVSFADRTITVLNKPGSPGGGAASLTRNGDIWEIGLWDEERRVSNIRRQQHIIRAAADALSRVRIGEETGKNVDDGDFSYTFVMADGAEWGVQFDFRDVFFWHGKNYEVLDADELLTLELQPEKK